MLIKPSRGWATPERLVTPEAVFLDRRRFLAAGAATAAALALPGLPRAEEAPDPTLDLYPAKLNDRYPAGRPVTPEDINGKYNNFYEFGSDKGIYDRAQALKTRPWSLTIDGMVEKPMVLGIDDLLRKVALEERVYRHRCVEAWSMTVPWTGFPLKSLVDLAKPLGSAKYVRFETFLDKEVSRAQSLDFGYPWPYVEGVTMAEATHDLAFLVTGAYGKPILKQFGAPIRLHLPWKYGFKSIKSIVKVSFTEERPKSFWEAINAAEYGFWANVNPEVPHPRWSQASERNLETGERVPTVLYNGYGEWVAGLYQGLEKERLFA